MKLQKHKLTKRLIFQVWEMSKKSAADWVKMDDLLDILEELENEDEKKPA